MSHQIDWEDFAGAEGKKELISLYQLIETIQESTGGDAKLDAEMQVIPMDVLCPEVLIGILIVTFRYRQNLPSRPSLHAAILDRVSAGKSVEGLKYLQGLL